MTAVIAARRTPTLCHSAAFRAFGTRALTPLAIRACRADAGIGLTQGDKVILCDPEGSDGRSARSCCPRRRPVTTAFVLAPRHTPLTLRGGAFKAFDVHRLAAPPIRACLADAGIPRLPGDKISPSNAPGTGCNSLRMAHRARGRP